MPIVPADCGLSVKKPEDLKIARDNESKKIELLKS